MSTNKPKRGPIVSLNLPTTDDGLLVYSKGLLIAFTGNAYFMTPPPTLGAFALKVDAYDQAHTTAATRVLGAVAHRAACRVEVIEGLGHIQYHVQGVVTAAPSRAVAAAIVESVGMSLRKAPKRSKVELEVVSGPSSGSVSLNAKAVAAFATYYWQFSEDGVSWTSVPETLQARTVISGLAPARLYYFRFRALTRSGAGDYSQVVSAVVH